MNSALPTFSVAGAVSVPIFEGGRVQGRLAQADAELRTRQAEAEDARAEIYYDVRTAFLDLKATEEELQTGTMLARQRQANSAVLGEHVSVFDQTTTTVLEQLKAGFMATGADAVTALIPLMLIMRRPKGSAGPAAGAH